MKSFFTSFFATSERRIALALIALFCMLYLPLAGNYGMWDPWETHYGEISRQMLERNDWISLWWPGSPQDRNEVFHKPVLHFWLMALSMKAFGIQGWGSHAAEMVDSWRVEWAARLPNILLSIAAIMSVWTLVRRLAGRRAAALSAVVLATSSQWAFITRQAMTDLPFVAPMTIALALGGLALLLPESEREAELPRRRWGRVSWPHARAFYIFVALFALTVVPQLVVISIQLVASLHLGSRTIHLAGVVPMLPYIAAFLVGLWVSAWARNKRQLYLFSAYVLCGLATLAKGPAGVALPGIVLVVFLILSGRWREIFSKLEIFRGPLLFVAVAFPWYHAMLIRHGAAFWNEFIGDNYVHRAGGRHGDRGTFEYYLQWAGYGMFPWSGIATVGGLLTFNKLRANHPRRGIYAFALTWFIVELSVMSLVNTKFHHYILPGLPALAILAGLLLDEVIAQPKRAQAIMLLVIGVPVTFFCGRDLAAFPPRLLWLFNYDYVNMPGTGRPWPTTALYGDRYEYGDQLMIFAWLATGVTLALAIFAWLGRRRGPELTEAPEVAPPAEAAPPATFDAGAVAPANAPLSSGPLPPAAASEGSLGRMLAGGGLALAGVICSFVIRTGFIWYGAIGVGITMIARELFRASDFAAVTAPVAAALGRADGAASGSAPGSDSPEPDSRPAPPLAGLALLVMLGFGLAAAIYVGPRSPNGLAPTIGRLDWVLPTALMLPFLGALIFLFRGFPAARPLNFFPWLLAALAVVWSGFLLDKLLIELSPHWAQKHVIASYFAKRRSPEEPLIAWQLYWRGENFYTRNEIYRSSNPNERTVFLGDHNAEKMQKFFNEHPNRRIFFVVERVRLESLRALLPAAARPTLQIVDESNNKIYLAVADLTGAGPAGPASPPPTTPPAKPLAPTPQQIYTPVMPPSH